MNRRFCLALATGLLLLGTPGLSRATGLIITGVIDGPLVGGTPKAVELHALNDIGDLSIYGLGFANNGGGSDGIEFTFSAAAAAAGDFIYVASDNEQFVNFFGFAPHAMTSAVTINGDDAVELFRNGVVVDVFGNIAEDGTGQPWEYLDGWAYRNAGTGGMDTTTFKLAEWHFSGINGLDHEIANATARIPFPAGSYSFSPTPQPVPTPEPAAILLLGTGLAGFAGKRLKRKIHTKAA